MSSRVTRSSAAKHSADSPASTIDLSQLPPAAAATTPAHSAVAATGNTAITAAVIASTTNPRKRKTDSSSDSLYIPAELQTDPSNASSTRLTKKAKLAEDFNFTEQNTTTSLGSLRTRRSPLTMASPGEPSETPPADGQTAAASSSSSSKRKAGKSRRISQEQTSENLSPLISKRTRPTGSRAVSEKSKASSSDTKTYPTSSRRPEKTTTARDNAAGENPGVAGQPPGKDEDIHHKKQDEHKKTHDDDEEEQQEEEEEGEEDDDEHEGEDQDDEDEEMQDDAFEPSTFFTPASSRIAGLGGGGGGAFSNAFRALSGLIGMTSRFRSILEKLRSNDPSEQHIALTQLSDLLLVSNEENLAGHFSPDQFVKELVKLMQPGDFGENPEMMLLACRCIANMMEALPQSTATVVYGNAVPVLVSKLLEIQYMDVAEQALTTLERISTEFPASIVREGGLSACLTYLDFFPTSVQRSAVTTAANCCRNLPEDSFETVKDIIPILLSVLNSNDQRVVEQGCLCVSRIAESLKYHDDKLEEIMTTDLLQAILRLLVPGSTNLIGPNTHTQFLKVLAITAKASPRLTVDLFKMNVVDTLYQILTGVSPPSGTENVAHRIDSVLIMQALIHRPRDQIFETLNVICELLPGMHKEHPSSILSTDPETYLSGLTSSPVAPVDSRIKNRLDLLAECSPELKRFATILLPTLTDAYSSTVNLSVRTKVLVAQIKMLLNLDTDILEDALRTVPYASFLASILSQQDHVHLVAFALQAAELLLSRMGPIYRSQFEREGVTAEIRKLADNDTSITDGDKLQAADESRAPEIISQPSVLSTEVRDDDDEEGDEVMNELDEEDAEVDDDDVAEADMINPTESSDEDEDEDEDDADGEDEDGDPEDDTVDIHEEEDDDHDGSTESSSSPQPTSASAPKIPNFVDQMASLAKRFIEKLDKDTNEQPVRAKAESMLDTLRDLVNMIGDCFDLEKLDEGEKLFKRLAGYFQGDALETVTSHELLSSGIISMLLDIFQNPDGTMNTDAQAAFIKTFMTPVGHVGDLNPTSGSAVGTPFSVLVHKLQDLFSRSEHFEVITVHNNSTETNRSSAASMLAKQIKLRLQGDESSGIPKHLRDIHVTIHAIATFKGLDDWLRPKMMLFGQQRLSRFRETPELPSMAPPESASRGVGAESSASGSTTTSEPRLKPPTATDDEMASLLRLTGRKFSSGRLVSGSEGSPLEQSSASPAGAASRTPTKRRSSRKSKSTGDDDLPRTPVSSAATIDLVTPSNLPPPARSDGLENTLECADEAKLTDTPRNEVEDNETAPDAGTKSSTLLDTIIGEIGATVDDDDDDEDGDEAAVDMEVASTGKVIARASDGTRIATPTQGSSSDTKAPTSSTEPRTPSEAAKARLAQLRGRLSSYAAAVQSTPTDWHLEFSIQDQPISQDTTIYRAVHFNQSIPREISLRTLWTSTHTITFKKVPGPPPDNSKLSVPLNYPVGPNAELPQSLEDNPITSTILKLLRVLHQINGSIDDILSNYDSSYKVDVEPLSLFVNTKLTAKLNRQLEEPLIVASNCLPNWSEDLARLYPFLFPFETRHLFLQSTSFGYSRSMTRWQNAQPASDSRRDRHRDERPFLGRLQRQKVRLSRSKMLESAIKVLDMYGSSPSMLEVEYFGETGTGLGPTLEFYSTVSKDFARRKLKLWRDNGYGTDEEFAFGQRGLYPAPMGAQQAEGENGKRVLSLFKALGKFVARAMLDSRIIDIAFNPAFFRINFEKTGPKPTIADVRSIDEDLAKSLLVLKQFSNMRRNIESSKTISANQKAAKISKIQVGGASLEDMGLDFTLPGYSQIELIANGSNTNVTIENVDDYIENVIDYTVRDGVHRQVAAFREGFSTVFPYSALQAFTPDELVMLFGQVKEDWSIETLMDSIKADHGYNLDSKSVKNLLQAMTELSLPERREFLQFITGSPKLPIGGFKSLTPMFTVVCKPSEAPYTSDDYLPSVMTCVNYLKLPDYSSFEVMKEKMMIAIKEGQGSFHLS